MNKSKKLLGLIEQEEPKTAEKGEDLYSKVVDFLRENPDPDDKKVHDLADSMGIDPDEIESVFYKLATIAATIGKHRDTPDDELDANELKMGIEVEHEHIDDEEIAKQIAKDHLAEFPDYYTRLKEMEGKG